MSLSNKSLQIAIRVDSSHEIGSGHVMRCLTLADSLKPHVENICFVCQRLSGDLVEFIIKKGYDVETNLASKVDWLIVDHYDLDKKWETEMRSFTDRIMVIDDLANRQHDCDLLLDQTHGRTVDDYKELVPKNCRLLLGTDYALIASQFGKLRTSSLQRRKKNYHLKNILISMGGFDPNHVMEFVLNAIQQLKIDKSINIMLGKHVDQSTFANMMLSADLAIAAGGTTSWERCCLGVPTVMITIADNQLNNANKLNQIGAVNYLGHYNQITSEKINQSVRKFIINPLELKNMSDIAATICDGHGARRIILEFFPELANDGSLVRFRRVDIKDAKIMFAWQQDPSTRRYARNPNPPLLSEHMVWLKKRLSDPDCIFNIILYRNQPAGILRLDKITNESNAYEISIVTAPNYRRLGLAGSALKLARKMFPHFEFRAQVLPENNSSHHLFRKEGYELSDGIYIHKTKEKI